MVGFLAHAERLKFDAAELALLDSEIPGRLPDFAVRQPS